MILVLLVVVLVPAAIYRYYFPPIPRRKKTYDYALLLGCPCHDDGSMRTSQIKRCQLAIDQYNRKAYNTLVITGGAVKNQYVESKEMERYILSQINIPILCETRSTNTFENFTFSKEIIQDHSVLILTSGTHARRACAIASRFFTDYSAAWYPEHRLKHVFREILSRIVFIKIELQKRKKHND
jgi:vancomycin permeability regulator SanA